MFSTDGATRDPGVIQWHFYEWSIFPLVESIESTFEVEVGRSRISHPGYGGAESFTRLYRATRVDNVRISTASWELWS